MFPRGFTYSLVENDTGGFVDSWKCLFSSVGAVGLSKVVTSGEFA